ncbi:MAG: hypothetical protein P8074_11475 [Anaerolineales bacterium]
MQHQERPSTTGLGGLDQLPQLVERAPIDVDAADVEPINAESRIGDAAGQAATRGQEEFAQQRLERLFQRASADGRVAAGVPEGALALAVQQVEDQVGHFELGAQLLEGITSQVVARLQPGVGLGFSLAAGVKDGMIAEFVAGRSQRPPACGVQAQVAVYGGIEGGAQVVALQERAGQGGMNGQTIVVGERYGGLIAGRPGKSGRGHHRRISTDWAWGAASVKE